MCRRISIVLSVILLCLSVVYADGVPYAIKYQAVLHDIEGSVLVNRSNVALRISLREKDPSGAILYREDHKNLTTDMFGMVHLEIGRGEAWENKTLEDVSWGKEPIYVECELELDGRGYTTMGTSELLSVPYAFFAGNADCIDLTLLNQDVLPRYDTTLHRLTNSGVYQNEDTLSLTSKQIMLYGPTTWTMGAEGFGTTQINDTIILKGRIELQGRPENGDHISVKADSINIEAQNKLDLQAGYMYLKADSIGMFADSMHIKVDTLRLDAYVVGDNNLMTNDLAYKYLWIGNGDDIAKPVRLEGSALRYSGDPLDTLNPDTLYIDNTMAYSYTLGRMEDDTVFLDTNYVKIENNPNYVELTKYGGVWRYNKDKKYVYTNADSSEVKVGVGTIEPLSRMHVRGGSILASYDQANDTETWPSIADASTYFIYGGSLGALRAGEVSDPNFLLETEIGKNSVGLGFDVQAKGKEAIALGNSLVVDADNAIALGSSINIANNEAIALGNRIETLADSSFALGNDLNLEAGINRSFTLGNENVIKNSRAFALGDRLSAEGDTSFVIGSVSKTAANNTFAIGDSLEANAEKTFVIGRRSAANSNNSFSIGDSAINEGKKAIAIGNTVSTTGENSLVLGYKAKIESSDPTREPSNSLAIGSNVLCDGQEVVSIGYNQHNHAHASVSIGASTISASSTIDNASYNSVNLGYRNQIKASENSTALGQDLSIAKMPIGVNIGYENTMLGIETPTTDDYFGVCIGRNLELDDENNTTYGGVVLGRYNDAAAYRSALGEFALVVGSGTKNTATSTADKYNAMELDIEGNLYLGDGLTTSAVYANGGIITTSDSTLKKNIKTLSWNYLGKDFDVLRLLKPVSFVYKADKTNNTRFGFIAQEVEQYFPNLVYPDRKGVLSLNYMELIPVLWKYTQDLEKENTELKSRVDALESELEKIKKALNLE